MGSLKKPHEGGTRMKSPHVGIVRWNSKSGNYEAVFSEIREGDNIIQASETVRIDKPTFIPVSTGYMFVGGGKETRGEFVPVSSPLCYYEGGLKWNQHIPVWIGKGGRAPAFVGKWSEIKDAVAGHGGAYHDAIFVLCSQFGPKLLRLEFKGNGITALGDALKNAGMKYKNELVSGIHILELVNRSEFEKMGSKFYAPAMKIRVFPKDSTQYPAWEKMAMDACDQCDEYAEYLIANQKGDQQDEPQQQPQSKQQYQQPDSAPPSWDAPVNAPEGEPLDAPDTGQYDDLPF